MCKTCSIQRDGFLPIHLAAYKGHVQVVNKLLEYCPNNDEIRDRFGRNILHLAAKGGKIDVVRYILKDSRFEDLINQKSFLKSEETPLHLAATACHPKVVYALTWDKRVKLDILNDKKQTALDLAMAKQHLSSLRQILTWTALKSGGAKPSSYKEQGIALKSGGANEAKDTALQEGKSVSGGTEQFKDRVDSLSVVSTLIMTASVAACLSVPGGAEGPAHLLHKAMFSFFVFCITVSLFSSMSATILLIFGKLGMIELLSFSFQLAALLLGAALVTLSLAFLAGVYVVISDLTWMATTFLVAASIFIFVIFLLYVLLYLPSSSTGKAMRYISYYPFVLLAWLAED